jgi:multidrug transporter EmrE-like cation transporter
MTKDEALKAFNGWKIIAWLLIIYNGIATYGETISILKAILSSLLLWAIIMIGYNWRDKEHE